MKKILFIAVVFLSVDAMEPSKKKQLEQYSFSHFFITHYNVQPFKKMSDIDKEAAIIGLICLTDLNALKEFLIEPVSFKFSEIGQKDALHALVDEYKDPKTIALILDLLIQHGVSVNNKDEQGLSILHHVICKAAETGITDLLELFLNRGADPHVMGRYNPYQVAYSHIKEQYGFKVLSVFIRKCDVQVPLTFQEDQSYITHIQKSQKLDSTTLQSCFIDALCSSCSQEEMDKALEVVRYKFFFPSEKLFPAAQEIALNIIVANHGNSDIGRFFLNVAIKYGLNLDVMLQDESITGLEYIVNHALTTGQTILFDEALKNNVCIYKSPQVVVDFLDFEKNQSANAKKLQEILKIHSETMQ